ncbi:hypothetical protein NE865_06592 [Phthorimaea operculella]|nr:hypothetical protein NE865_06592 [Phthorimaea operculella]
MPFNKQNKSCANAHVVYTPVVFAHAQVAFRECCIVAKMKKYGENETVLGDGIGVRNYVYFVLTGRVQMIESLKVFVSKRLGKNFYTLFDPWVPPEPSETDFEKKYFANYRTLESSEDVMNTPTPSKRSIGTQMHMDSITQSILKVKSRRYSADKILKIKGVPSSLEKSKASKMEIIEEENELIKQVSDKASAETKRASFDAPSLRREKSYSISGAQMVSMGTQVGGSTQTVELRKMSLNAPSMLSSKLLLPPLGDTEHVRQSVRYSVNLSDADSAGGEFRDKRNLKTFFMQVCIMNPGCTFGFGENMRDRRIVAMTPVTCMLIPKMWLLQHNTANIWTRIQYYLQKKIPNKNQLFDEFCKQRVWEDFREQCVNDVVSNSNTVNYTSLHDVPYSVRLEEMFNL